MVKGNELTIWNVLSKTVRPGKKGFTSVELWLEFESVIV